MQYKIGYISKISGITPRTLRFYETKKLLVPKKDIKSNYRYYTDKDIIMLQQILIYKELGFSLDEIKPLLQGLDDNTLIKQLEKHLVHLKEKKNQVEKMINTVNLTIDTLKGEQTMKNEQKFEGFKDNLIKENDEKFKDEVIHKYGKDSYEKSTNAFKGMSEDTYNHMNELNTNLIKTLIELNKDKNNKVLKEKAFTLHKEWITLAWGSYNKNAHQGVVDLYVTDDRFKSFYDQHDKGLAQLLRDTVFEMTK